MYGNLAQWLCSPFNLLDFLYVTSFVSLCVWASDFCSVVFYYSALIKLVILLGFGKTYVLICNALQAMLYLFTLELVILCDFFTVCFHVKWCAQKLILVSYVLCHCVHFWLIPLYCFKELCSSVVNTLKLSIYSSFYGLFFICFCLWLCSLIFPMFSLNICYDSLFFNWLDSCALYMCETSAWLNLQHWLTTNDLYWALNC